MKLIISLIRNGEAMGDTGGVLLGCLDTPLSEHGKTQLSERCGLGVYPEAQLVYSSTLSRCVQTAGIIYAHTPAIVMGSLRAFDYGNFSGKNAGDIMHDPEMLAWARDASLSAVPDGEDPYYFLTRCGTVFQEIVAEMQGKDISCAAVITHRQVISVILQRFCIPRSYYTVWNVQNAGGFTLVYDPVSLSAKISSAF